MKKIIITSLIVVMILSLGTAFANPEGVCPEGKLIGKLNLIGVKSDKDKNANMEDKAAGSVIFVGLGSDGVPDRTDIYLIQGDDFAVLDKNGTDGEASFQLPPTGLEAYVLPAQEPKWSAYSVYVRALGKPGGKATITTCAELAAAFGPWISQKTTKALSSPEIGDTVCSIEQVTSTMLVRNTGKSKFINVTAELLTILFQVTLEDDTVIYVRVPIFSNLLEGEYWKYENEGLKNCEIRFYDCPTDVSENDPT